MSWKGDFDIQQAIRRAHGAAYVTPPPTLRMISAYYRGMSVPTSGLDTNYCYFGITPESIPNPFATDITFEVDSVLDMYYQVRDLHAGYDDPLTAQSAGFTRRAIPITMPEAGTIKSVSYYFKGKGRPILFGIYDDDSGMPNVRLGVASVGTTPTAALAWYTYTLATGVTAAAGEQLWLAYVTDTSFTSTWDTMTPGHVLALSNYTYADGMPGTFGTNATNPADNGWAMYATYEPIGIGATLVDYVYCSTFSAMTDYTLKKTPRIVFGFGRGLNDFSQQFAAPAECLIHVITKEGWYINGVSYPSHHFILRGGES